MDNVIGLMSGTSVDGIDAALVRTDGDQLERICAAQFSYRKHTRESILTVYKNPQKFLADFDACKALSLAIAQDHARAVLELIKLSNRTNEQIQNNDVRLLGFHGQTVLHLPQHKKTVQLGDALELAALSNIDTVHNFRAADMRNGGQGAPLAPVYHQCLMHSANAPLPCVFLNVGGVANISYWDGDTLLGFDTGPGNGLVDQYMQRHYDQPYDTNGQLAAKGQVNQSLLDTFLQRDYFQRLQPTPRSLDRAEFNDVLHFEELTNLSAADAMATLLAMTVQSVGLAIETLPIHPKQVVVCGGGQHNHTLMQQLKAVLNCTLSSANNLGIPGDFIEAELMALLAARRLRDLTSTYPSTTGASVATVAGDIQLA